MPFIPGPGEALQTGLPVKRESIGALALELIAEDCHARRLAPRTRRRLQDDARTFLRWASQRSTSDPRALGKKDLVAFHVWLTRQDSKRSGEPLARGTVAERFRAVLRLYSCLYRAGLIEENPAQNLALGPKEPRIFRRRPLTRDEISRFLESIDPESAKGLRDRTLFELIYSSGLRVSEAVGLKVGDIDFDERLMVVRGKFDRDRMVPISQVAHDFLAAYLGARRDHPDASVFPGYRGHLTACHVSDHFRELLARAGIAGKELCTHSIRHSTATHLLENGASVRHVQELLGHANIESTVRYTHVMVDGLLKVYRRYHPREHELFEIMDAAYEEKLARL